jgi:hypothetical protein
VRSGENGWNSSCVTDTLSVDSADRVWNRPVNRVFGNYLIIQSMPRHSNITFWCSLPGSSTLIRRCACFFARILTVARERLHASGAGSSGASLRPSDTRGDARRSGSALAERGRVVAREHWESRASEEPSETSSSFTSSKVSSPMRLQ